MELKKEVIKPIKHINKNRNKNKFYNSLFKTKNIFSRRWRTYRGYPYDVFEEYKTIFVPVYKSGTTTVGKTLKKIAYKRRYHPFVKNRDFLKKYKDEYFLFSFVRNPYDRMVSGYFDKIKKNYNKTGKVYRNLPPGKFNEKIRFKEFVKKILEKPDKKIEDHFRSQYRQLTDKEGNLIPDFIGKVENFDKDFRKVCKKMGIPRNKIPKIEKQNTTKRDRDYREYYDKETRKLVQERYKKDLELFDYSF